MKQVSVRPTFFDRLTVRRFQKSLPKDLVAQFDEGLQNLLEAEAAYLSDKSTLSHTVFGCCVLTLYRVLNRSGLSNIEAKAKISVVISGEGKWANAVAMWMTIKFSTDPFRSIQNYAEHRLPENYGPSFEIKHVDTPKGFVSEVLRCGYHSFLKRHHATELLPLFCEWDRVWIDHLPKSVGFKRRYTLATGGSSCRFEFFRQDDD